MMQTILSNSIGMVLIILIINIIYGSFFTIRMILTVKGRRYFAAGISTIESLVYVTGLSLV
ncbi:DUF5698 domain-containing protein, partial [Bacillus sp. SIMBA_033]|uniref:DUF5698 domain-containing protein n=1 Tax=Bacillus sp. SIMBA_033 TaxID=3085776 RepID=UPI00397B1CEB